MTRRRKKKKEATLKLSRGKVIDPILLRARRLRASLLRRVSPELKDTTPTISQLEKWLRLPHYLCRYSLQELTLDEMTVDHCIPLTRGGSNELDNLCFSSSSMNTAKGSLTDSEFMELLQLISTWEDGGEYLLRRLKMGNNIFKR